MLKRGLLKKTISLMLIVMLVLSLSACGGGRDEPAPADGNGAEPGDEPIVLTFLHVFSGPRGEAVDRIVQGFNRSQDGIIVEHEHIPGFYGGLRDRLQTLSVANQLPDLALMGLSGHNFMQQGLNTVCMQSYIDDENYDLSPIFPFMLELGWDEDGRQHAMPFVISTPLLFANKELFEEAGVEFTDQPESWEQVRAMAKQIADNTAADGIAFGANYDTWQFQLLLETFGGKMADVENQKVTFNEEPGLRTMQFWSDLMHVDKTWPHATGAENQNNFLNGDLGIMTATTGNMAAFSASATFDMGIMLLPLYDDMQNRNPRVIPAGGANLYLMPSTPERQAAAWEFVKYTMTQEAGAEIVEGMGYMAPREDLLAEDGLLADFIAQNPQAIRSYDMIDDCVAWFAWPGTSGPRIDSVFLENFEAVFLQSKTAEEAMHDTAREVEAILGW